MRQSMPPGPKLLPPLQTLALATRPLPFLQRCRRRFGDVFTLNVPPYGTTLYVADPSEIGPIFQASTDVFRVGAARHSNALAVEAARGTNVPDRPVRSLMLEDAEEHLRDRKLMLPPFKGEAVERRRELVTEIAHEELDRWPLGRPFALHPPMQRISLEVMLRVIFGIEDASRLQALRDGLPEIFNLNPLLVWLPWLRRDFGPQSPERRFQELRQKLSEIVMDEIRDRRADPQLLEREDVLSFLVRAELGGRPHFDDLDVHDQLATLLLAGNETTAAALAWAFDLLLHHPGALARLEAELETEEPHRAKYLDAVVRETLRCRTIVPTASRKLIAPYEIRGYEIPPGTIVRVALMLTHAREQSHPDPHAFRPERFLDGRTEPYSWIPFGGGVRHCLGDSFSIMEMKQTLATVLGVLDLQPAAPLPDRPTLRNWIMVPKNGPMVVAGRRRSAPASERAAVAVA